MSLIPDSSIPPGWYPDPAGSFQQRWWNGSGWTNDFAQYRPSLNQPRAAAVAIAIAPAASVATAVHAAQPPVEYTPSHRTVAAGAHSALASVQPAAAATSTLVRDYPEQSFQAITQVVPTTFSIPTVAPAALVPVTGPTPSISLGAENPNLLDSYQPFGMIPAVRRGHREKPRTLYTVASWFIAISPLFAIGVAAAIALLIPELYTRFAQGAIVILFLGAVVGLAFADRGSLLRHGHERCASPAWSLLEPLYLLMRAIATSRETGRVGVLPLILNVVVIAGIAVALWLQPTWLALLVTAS